VAEDDEPHRFRACVLASLARVDAELVRPAAHLQERDDDADVDGLWVITLVQSLGDRGRELVLVLDDVQHLTHPRIGRMLQWLREYALPLFHLLLLTRGSVPVPLERSRAQGQLAEFDLPDLRFTAEESARFLREQLGPISEHEAARLHETTDGWIAGLQLLAIQRKAARGP
jgi:LuxR family maltose regulon positive regulatory protein